MAAMGGLLQCKRARGAAVSDPDIARLPRERKRARAAACHR